MPELTHLNKRGAVRMVDVGAKRVTRRTAAAAGTVSVSRAVVARLRRGEIAKGNVLAIAKTAAILAAKRTAELIPLCHPLALEHVDLDFEVGTASIEITARVALRARTGAEMEALTAVSVAALTIYDMCKSLDRGMVIGEIRLLEKRGGKSGHWRRAAAGGSAATSGARRRARTARGAR